MTEHNTERLCLSRPQVMSQRMSRLKTRIQRAAKPQIQQETIGYRGKAAEMRMGHKTCSNRAYRGEEKQRQCHKIWTEYNYAVLQRQLVNTRDQLFRLCSLFSLFINIQFLLPSAMFNALCQPHSPIPGLFAVVCLQQSVSHCSLCTDGE